MNVVTRGIRNAFRNTIRTSSIVIIIGLAIGLGLSMLVARQAVSSKIASVNSDVGTVITVSPAGLNGFEGGGNPLTESQLGFINSLANVSSTNETLSDRLTTSNSNLTSAITAGSLGKRFGANSGASFQVAPGGASGTAFNFTPPVTVTGTNNPNGLASLVSNAGGNSIKLTSGQLYSSSSTADVALIGSTLASANNLKVGSTFTGYNTTITVVGIFDAGTTFANNQVVMPLATVQSLSSQPNDVTSDIVTANALTNVTSVTNAIQKKLGSAADVTNEIQQAQNSITPLENIKSITLYSLIGALIAGAVIIFLIMLMIVRERRREIGVLKAIGASNLVVMWQFMSEAVTLTILGAVIGILIGVAAANPITKTLVNNSSSSGATISINTGGGGGGSFRAFSSGGGGIRLGPQAGRGTFRGLRNSFSNIHAIVGWSIILYGIAAALIIAILGSAAASLLIAKIRPAEVIRTE
jgi:putative ABC transport system permease protein